MAELPHDVGRLLRDPVDDETVRRLWRRVGERRVVEWRGERRLRRRTLGTMGAFAAAAAAAFLLLRPPEQPTTQLRLTDGTGLADVTAEQPLLLELDDGTTIRLFAGARIAPGASDGTARVVRLLQGRVVLDVPPGSPRGFRVDAGRAVVEVVGTRFGVLSDPDHVQVSVTRGRVRVLDRSTGAWTLLAAGEQLTVPRPPEPAAALDPTPAEPTPAEVVVDDPGPGPGAPPATRQTQWRTLAERGDYAAAWEALGAEELARRLPRASAEELLALADVARRAGQPRHAIAPLERVLSHHDGDPRAPLAAYTLGVVQMDRLGDPASAVAAFERASEMGLRGTLREHALARMAICLERMGRHSEARVAASEYLRSHPDGALAGRMRRLGQD